MVARPDTDEQLGSLCTRSLLERRNDRYGGYAFVREYASARLADDPAREAEVFARHGRCMLARTEAFGRSGQERGRAMSRDRGNLRVAAERAAAVGRVDVAVGCTIAALDIIGREGPYELGVELIRGTLQLEGIPAEERSLLLLRLAVLCQGTGLSDGEAELREGLAEAERGYQLALEAHPALANAWIGLAGVGFRRGSFEAVRIALRRATRLQARDPGIRIAAGRIHAGLGDRRQIVAAVNDLDRGPVRVGGYRGPVAVADPLHRRRDHLLARAGRR